MRVFLFFIAVALVFSFLIARYAYHDSSCMVKRCVVVKH